MTNEVGPFAVMAKEMISWSKYIFDNTSWQPGCIDIGGGWTYGKWYGTGPNSQIDDDKAPTYSDYAREITNAIVNECKNHNLDIPKLRMNQAVCYLGPVVSQSVQ